MDDELASGDLTLFSQLQLDLGSHRIGAHFEIGDATDLDDFTFRVPVGTCLVSATLVSYDVQPNNPTAVPNSVRTSFRLDSLAPPGTLVPTHSFLVYSNWSNPDPLVPSPVTLFTAALPLEGGAHQIRNGSSCLGIPNPGGGFNYTWILLVSDSPNLPVPEIPTSTDTVVGLAALAVWRRRRQGTA
jgi:hypothetical protein